MGQSALEEIVRASDKFVEQSVAIVVVADVLQRFGHSLDISLQLQERVVEITVGLIAVLCTNPTTESRRSRRDRTSDHNFSRESTPTRINSVVIGKFLVFCREIF